MFWITGPDHESTSFSLISLFYIPLKCLPSPHILYDNFEVHLNIHKATSDIFSSL